MLHIYVSGSTVYIFHTYYFIQFFLKQLQGEKYAFLLFFDIIIFTFALCLVFFSTDLNDWGYLLSAWRILVFLVRQIFQQQILFLSGKVLISPLFFKCPFHLYPAVLDTGFLIDKFFLWALWIYYYIASHLQFLLRSQLLILLGFPYKCQVIFLLLLSRFFPSFWLSAFLLWCVCLWVSLCWSSLEFIELPEWTYRLLFSISLGSFSRLYIFSLLSSYSHYTYVGTHLPISHISLRFYIFLHYFSLLLSLHNLHQSVLKCANSFFFCQFESTLSTSSEFFTSVIMLSNSRILLVFIISISLLLFFYLL